MTHDQSQDESTVEAPRALRSEQAITLNRGAVRRIVPVVTERLRRGEWAVDEAIVEEALWLFCADLINGALGFIVEMTPVPSPLACYLNAEIERRMRDESPEGRTRAAHRRQIEANMMALYTPHRRGGGSDEQ